MLRRKSTVWSKWIYQQSRLRKHVTAKICIFFTRFEYSINNAMHNQTRWSPMQVYLKCKRNASFITFNAFTNINHIP